jgi:uncharacterized membrane protein required for colicin V production
MELSKLLISLGAGILAVGLLLKFAPGLLNWFGKLPGDIRIQSQNSFIFIPITSMIVVSLLLTLIVNLFFRK